MKSVGDNAFYDNPSSNANANENPARNKFKRLGSAQNIGQSSSGMEGSTNAYANNRQQNRNPLSMSMDNHAEEQNKPQKMGRQMTRGTLY